MYDLDKKGYRTLCFYIFPFYAVIYGFLMFALLDYFQKKALILLFISPIIYVIICLIACLIKKIVSGNKKHYLIVKEDHLEIRAYNNIKASNEYDVKDLYFDKIIYIFLCK